MKLAHRLRGLGFDDGKVVIVVGLASGAPAHKAFFAFMPGIGYVAGKSAVVVVRGLVGNVFAYHLPPPAVDENE